MLIIYISGIDGCGKTTQAKLLQEYLISNGYSAEYQWLRWEPSIVPLIKKLRKFINKKAEKTTENKNKSSDSENAGHHKWSKLKKSLFSSALFRKIWLFYATSDYYRSYKKAYKSWTSDYIIMDRYIIDFIIDQSLNFGIEVDEFIDNMQNTSIVRMKPATLSVLIDIPADVGYQRKLDGTSLTYLDERRYRYLSIPDSDQVLRIDGTMAVNLIQESIRQWIADKLQSDR